MPERSHGKVRPSLPRVAELKAVETGPTSAQRTADRDTSGRFTRRNKAGTVRTSGVITRGMSAAAKTVYLATLRTLPSRAAPVQGICALYARSLVRSGQYDEEADRVGVTTVLGRELATLATEEGKRAERLAVTMHALAAQHAEQEAKSRPPAWMQWKPTDEDDDEEQDDDEPTERVGQRTALSVGAEGSDDK